MLNYDIDTFTKSQTPPVRQKLVYVPFGLAYDSL